MEGQKLFDLQDAQRGIINHIDLVCLCCGSASWPCTASCSCKDVVISDGMKNVLVTRTQATPSCITVPRLVTRLPVGVSVISVRLNSLEKLSVSLFI